MINQSQNKTQPTKVVVKDFLFGIKDERQRKDVLEKINKGSSGQTPRYCRNSAVLAHRAARPRGIKPLLRRHSDGMKASFHSAPR